MNINYCHFFVFTQNCIQHCALKQGLIYISYRPQFPLVNTTTSLACYTIRKHLGIITRTQRKTLLVKKKRHNKGPKLSASRLSTPNSNKFKNSDTKRTSSIPEQVKSVEETLFQKTKMFLSRSTSLLINFASCTQLAEG